MRKLKLNPASAKMLSKYQKLLKVGQKFGKWQVVSTEIKQYWNKMVYIEVTDGYVTKYIPYTRLKTNPPWGSKNIGLKNYRYFRSRWRGIWHRCYDTRVDSYVRYGGRGIKLSDEFHDCRVFCKYVSELPRLEGQTQIDRIDNNGDYERGNLRWLTPMENSNNRSNTIWVNYKGGTLSLCNFMREHTTLDRRQIYYLYKKGLTPEQIIAWDLNQKNSLTDS